MNGYKKIVASVRDRKIKAKVSFDAIWEAFEWVGEFEQFHAKWRSKFSYDEVELMKEDYVLTLRYYKREDSQTQDYLSYLPYEVGLNSKHFGRFELETDREERILIEEHLRNLFEQGQPVDFEIFSPRTKEKLEVLIFGYFTYKRFINFLEQHFPEFWEEMRSYIGKPVMEILDVFKSVNLSLEELELELKKAVNLEDFERASFLRDKIKSLKTLSYKKG